MKHFLLILVLLLCSCTTMKKFYSQYDSYNIIKENNLLYVKLTLNDTPTLFLVDSGASKSFLDINKTEKYSFNYINKPIEKFAGVVGIGNIYTVMDYKIKEMHIPFLGISLEELNPYFSKDNLKVAGLIGSDYLLSRNAIIDYENSLLYLKKGIYNYHE